MKTIIVTGSTSGIGLGIAENFARAGYNVVLNGLGKTDEIEETRARLASLGAGDVIFHGANMLKPDEITDLVKTAEARFGSVDVIVPNAGIQHVEKIEDFPPEKWDAIIAINLSSAFHLVRAAMPIMKKQKFGRIIAIASAHALVASPYKSAYVAAKHGILGLMKTVAGRCRIRDHRQCDLPRLCRNTACQRPDRRHGKGARHERERSDQ